MKPLKRVGDNHRTAIRMKIEGCSGREIAETIGVDLRTVYLWFSDPLIKDELAAQRQRVFDVFADRVSEVGLRAIKVLEDTLELKLDTETITVEQRVTLVREILDRIPFTAKQGAAIGTTPSRPTPPEAMSDEDLVREFRQVAALMPGVAVEERVPGGNGSG